MGDADGSRWGDRNGGSEKGVGFPYLLKVDPRRLPDYRRE